MARGTRAFDADVAEAATARLAEHSGEVAALFETAATDPAMEALPVIWTRWDDFTRIGKQMETSALALADAAKSASSAKDILPQLGEVGKTCKSCHEGYRVDD